MAEKRNFRRYQKASVWYLKHDGKVYEAKSVDYSPSGAGIILNTPLLLKKGDIIEIASESPKFIMSGEIVRLSDHKGLMVGIKNIGQIKGQMRDYRFADIVIGLQRSEKTGLLKVGEGEIVNTVYIREGDMIFSSSSDRKYRLGDMLVSDLKITAEQYSYAAKEMEKTGLRLGKVLVNLGYIHPKELWKVVRVQIEEIILSLFVSQDGWYVFEDSPLPTNEGITLKLSAANLIYNGIKKINDIKRIMGELPSLDSILCLSSDPLNLFQNITLDDIGQKIISCIDNRLSIKEIVNTVKLDKLKVFSTIHALLSVKLLETKDKESLIYMPGDMKEDILKPKFDPGFKEMVEDVFRIYERIGYYGILEVEDSASASELKRAYFRAAKKFHPDMHFHIDDHSIKNKLGHIFSYISEAYTTLSDSQKKTEYDKKIARYVSMPESGWSRAKEKFEQGKEQFMRNRYHEAELLFGQAVYFDDRMAEGHYYLGVALTKQNKLKEASKAISTALKFDPYNERYMTELGEVYLALGLSKRAMGLFERILSVSPNNSRAFSGLAKLKERVK